jgi:hypothetical protein
LIASAGNSFHFRTAFDSSAILVKQLNNSN